MTRGLEHVTKEVPCAVCAHSTWCCRLSRFHLCMRVESNKPAVKGGWLHPRDAEYQNAPIPPRPRRVSDAELRIKWEPIAMAAAASGRDRLPQLAREIGVDPESLSKLNVGYSELGGSACWTFPERNARGWIVGISRRLLVAAREGDNKRFCKGSRRGLTYCDGWDQYPGNIIIVEGGSDTAAGIAMGLCVIGRPSNTGGIEMLAQLLRPYRDRRIIVMGENDKKSALYLKQMLPPHDPECRCCPRCWPGKFGMLQTAISLANKLNRTIGTKLPQHGFKDIRDVLSKLILTHPEELLKYADGLRGKI